MCEDSVVVIRDVTNIALIGNETTATKSVQVGDGEVVDVIEPSTVIDCHGCPTGFVFTNVSEVTIYTIMLAQCGGYLSMNFNSSLTIVTVYNLRLDRVAFRKNTGNYSLVAINVLGQSAITNTSVQQNVSLSPAYQQGNVFLSYTEHVYPLKMIKEKNILYVESLVLFYTANGAGFTSIHNSWPYLSVKILSCSFDIKLSLKYITIHTTKVYPIVTRDVTNPDKGIIKIVVCGDATKYQIDVQTVRLSSAQQDVIMGPALMLQCITCAKMSHCPITTWNIITVTDVKVTDVYWVECYHGFTYGSITEHRHQAMFDRCKFPYFGISDGTGHDLNHAPYYIVTIRDTTIEGKHNTSYHKSLIHAVNVRYLLIDNCNFLHNWGGSGLFIESSIIAFQRNITFYNNTAKYGGGILMTGSKSLLNIYSDTTLNFTKNSALITGGALHIDPRDGHDGNDPICSIQLHWTPPFHNITHNAELHNIHFIFQSNTAGVAGTEIWGGSLETTCYMGLFSWRVYTRLAGLFQGFNNELTPSAISSSPQDICHCKQEMVCTSSQHNNVVYGSSFSLYPGQSLEVEVAIAGQLNGLVPGVVQAELKDISDEHAHLGNLQRTQKIDQAKCTVLVYTIHSSISDTVIELHLRLAKTTGHASDLLNYYDDILLESQVDSIITFVTLKNCPVGFQHNLSIGSCACPQALLHYMDNTSCDINTQTVQRTPTLWINASFTGSNTQILAVHQHCPFDYCDPNKHRLDLSYPDQQCAHNRSGILCGGCYRGLSLTLGSPKCKQCSNRYLSLLLVFPLAGIALVAVLTCLNLTVSVGTINGLILYANIIRAIHPVFFPSTSILSVFIAWMNLDIGMESCLYNGMDFYGLTWLQFVFPVYIWLLVSIMIITSHYSTSAAKLVGRHAVKVLATLFLLSYAKLLRTIITVLSFTYISYEHSDGTTYRSAVWLYDGNVGFVEGKHIPLFLTAICFAVIYIIPFTLLLLLAPFLQVRSHRYRALRWVNKLMPFLDAYQGPYKSRFRFWSGLLLVARVVLFVGFAMNSLGDPQINLKQILTFLITLFSLQWLFGVTFGYATLYSKRFINFLEAFYLCNLGVLSTWSLLQLDSNTSSKKAQTIITSVCVGLAFLVWLCILAYHTYQWLTGLKYGRCLLQILKARSHSRDEAFDPPSPQAAVQQHSAVVQKTYIELRESLLTDH